MIRGEPEVDNGSNTGIGKREALIHPIASYSLLPPFPQYLQGLTEEGKTMYPCF